MKEAKTRMLSICYFMHSFFTKTGFCSESFILNKEWYKYEEKRQLLITKLPIHSIC